MPVSRSCVYRELNLKLLVTGPASVGNVLCTVGLSVPSCSCLILVDSSLSVSAVRSVAASYHLALKGAQEDAAGSVFFPSSFSLSC